MDRTYINRRQALWQVGGGFAGVALSALLAEEQATAKSNDITPNVEFPLGDDAKLREFHVRPRAKRVIQLFMAGAASHIDLFDYKPDLEKYHGQASNFGEHVEAFQNGLGPWMKSPFKFQ